MKRISSVPSDPADAATDHGPLGQHRDRPTSSRYGANLKLLVLAGALALALITVACGGNDAPSSSSSDNGHDSGSMDGGVMGEAAAESEADRTIEIVMLDELAYDPAALEVSQGDVVTFEVVNDGSARHEFVLGDSAYQEMHEDAMTDDGNQGMTDNALSLGPGESGSLTWRFTESGKVLYGCHEPGHYEGGMVGTIEVE